jgi:acyl-CoA thioester hydrolase
MFREHTVELRVRYQETDAMGVLHHANYLTYFEVGRTELLRACGVRYRELEEQGLLMVVVRIACHYRLPARYDDLLELRTATKRVTVAKIEHVYELSRDGLLLATGESTLACVDRQGRVQRVPEWLRAGDSE